MEKDKVKIVSKGYTITVVSWENDGDNYNTKSLIVETLEEVTALVGLVKMSKSKNSSKFGLGNTYGRFNQKQLDMIVDYMKDNLILVKDPKDFHDFDSLISWWQDYNYNLLGSSEHYSSRVMESYIVTHSAEDIFVDKVKI